MRPTLRSAAFPLMFCLLFALSAILSAFPPGLVGFLCARLIGGLGIGVSTVAAPAYVSEIAPPGKRGKLVAMFQFNIVFGILMAFVSNYLLRDLGDNAWRWMLGVEAAPALIYSFLVLGVPESPRWLMEYKNDEEAAREVMKGIMPEAFRGRPPSSPPHHRGLL